MAVGNDNRHVGTFGIPADLPAGHPEVKSAKVPQGNDLALAKVIDKAIEKRIYDASHILMLCTSLVTYLCNQVFSNNACHPASW